MVKLSLKDFFKIIIIIITFFFNNHTLSVLVIPNFSRMA